MEDDRGFSDMKDKEETLVHNCPNKKGNDHIIVEYMKDSNELWIQQPWRYDEGIAFVTYCPFCGRHAEEIALEFVDDKDLEVAQNGS